MNKISIIGNFGSGKEQLGGQTVKTRIVTDEILKAFGSENVWIYNTAGGLMTLLKSPVIAFRALKRSRNVVIFPAQHGIRVFVPLLVILQKFFRKRRVHYVVIGGWLPKFIKNKPLVTCCLRKIYKIYAETHSMEKDLNNMGYIDNVTYMPNFKPLNIVDMNNIAYPSGEPYRLCTFSRVWSMKGIADAVDAVKYVNEKKGSIIYNLDIYGKIEEGEEEWFANLQRTFPTSVRYCGTVAFDKSVDVLKNYFCLLFPTRYSGEGIPGTIIDAYAAGLPVVSSLYPNLCEILEEGNTGYGYEFENVKALEELLCNIADNPQQINSLRKNCVMEAKKFQPKEAVGVLIKNLLKE